MMNIIFCIVPYKHSGTWVFDDPDRDLIKEPFVAGVPEILDRLTEDIKGAEEGFRLTFSAGPFPGCALQAYRMTSEYGGSWYQCPQYGAEGWLCPALLKYFKSAPPELYVRADPV